MNKLWIEKGSRIQFCIVAEFEFETEDLVYYRFSKVNDPEVIKTSTSKYNFYKWFKPLTRDIEERIISERTKLEKELEQLIRIQKLLDVCQ